MASLSFSALKSSIGKPLKSWRRGSGNFDESIAEPIGSWQARLREGRNFFAFLTLLDSSTLNVEKNSLPILPHSVGSSRKGRRPAFTPCYWAFGIRFTVRGASFHRPNGSHSPSGNSPGMRTQRNRSAVNSYSESVPCGEEAATTNVN